MRTESMAKNGQEQGRKQQFRSRTGKPVNATATVKGDVVTKIERYQWTTTGSPGKFTMIAKEELMVDHDYQRYVSNDKVEKMARDWNWSACGALSVSQRDDGYYTLDGQHRVVAAMRRADIKKLPCLVFHLNGRDEEAMAFLACNTMHRPVSALDQFKAKLMTGDPAAQVVNRLVKEADYTMNAGGQRTGRVIYCTSTMLRMATKQPAILEIIWPVLVAAAKDGPILERPLTGLCFIEAKLAARGLTLTNPPWLNRVLHLGIPGLQQAAQKAAVYHARGGPRIWAEGIVLALNGDRTKNVLSLDGDEPEGDD